MKVLVAKRKTENKLRYYNGKCFVIGKNRAIDISIMNTEETSSIAKTYEDSVKMIKTILNYILVCLTLFYL